MKLPELLTALLTVIIFSSCNKEDEPIPQVIQDDPIEITTNQICISKTYVMHNTDTVVYDEQCFAVDTAYIKGNGDVAVLMWEDIDYGLSVFFNINIDTSTIRNPGGFVNNIPLDETSITAQQCSEGTIIITKDSANMVSGTFYGSGWVYQQDTLFSVSGSFENVIYR